SFSASAASPRCACVFAAPREIPSVVAISASESSARPGLAAGPWNTTRAASDREQVAGAGVGGRVAQLRHRARLDLTDALTREVEVLADLLERARLAAVEPEAQREDLALPLVERGEELLDLVGQQRGGRDLERRLGRAVLDDVAQLRVTVLAQRLG